MKKFQYSIHLFQCDLRLHDNTALIAALSQSDQVVPVFIFDERQHSDLHKGENSFQFMVNSLNELDYKLRGMGSQLYLFSGITEELIERLLYDLPVEAVFLNR